MDPTDQHGRDSDRRQRKSFSGDPTGRFAATSRETGGALRISGILAASGQSGTCGDGTIGHIFVDGVEVFQRSVFNLSLGYSIVVSANGGSVIDFAIDPGPGGDDSCDATTFTAVVRTVNDIAKVADTIADWSDIGQQGYKSWTYGSFIKTNATTTYAVSRFGAFSERHRTVQRKQLLEWRVMAVVRWRSTI